MSQTASTRRRRMQQPVVLKLPADLGIDQVAALKSLFADQQDQPLVQIDAGDVARVHAAALQVFCLFCRGRSTDGHRTSWNRPTEVLRSAAALMDMSSLLQIVEAEAA